jgi:signal transduction histidine kinase
MNRLRSLRRLLLLGTVVFGVAAVAVLVGVLLLFESLRQSSERETLEHVAEQRGADEIVNAVYGQILAAYQHLQSPSEQSLERFGALGQRAYSRLRDYLFQPMPIEARLQVEKLKELHQTLEVEAHGAFALIQRGEAEAARALIPEMHRLADQLQAEMGRFEELRDLQRARLHAEQTELFKWLLAGILAVGAVLAVFAALFVRLMQRRVVIPLAHLAEAATRLGSGNLGIRIPPQRYAELETVARSFNQMADGIQEARSEIESQNVELSDTIRNLKQMQRELVQQEKLGAIGFMLAGLAHELNNPLAGILGSAECVAEELDRHSDPAVRRVSSELVTPLIREAGRAGDLVRNLLRFSRQSNAQLASVNLKVAVDISAGLRGYAFFQAGKALSVEVPEGLFVAVEAQRLEHVVMNIMSNALEAMRDGGGTRLEVRAQPEDDDWVSLTFQDDGPGFLEVERIFDPFYTTKPVGSGTGLGLSLVQRFVTEAGGTITAENAPSGGARLTIRLRAAERPASTAEPADGEISDLPQSLPPAADPEAVPSPAPIATDPGAAGKPRILVVDDEPALREIQRRFLVKLGIDPLIATTGAEAVSILQREPCDAVITDIRMPGDMDGVALFHWIEVHRPELAARFLFVTGEIAGGDNSVLGAHPGRVITKPFTRADYVARVLQVLEDVSEA